MRVLNLVTTERPFFRQQVAAVERRGVSCTTVSVPGQYDPASERSRSALQYLRFYALVLRRIPERFDVVHANYGLTAPAALAQPRRPVVLSLWGTDVYGRFGWLTRRCARYCDAVVAMSPELADVVDTDCEILPHPVDLERFAPRPPGVARDELGWEDGPSHVLFPYSPNRAVKNYPRAERVVERAERRLGRPVELHAISGVPHERVPTYMNASDALVLTSDHEGSPNAVKEAMACNLPVVATAVGDVEDLLDGVSPSAACRDDDELVDALASILRADERSNGREAVRPYGLEWYGETLVGIYESVTG